MPSSRICRAQTTDSRNRFHGSAPGDSNRKLLGLLLALFFSLFPSDASRADALTPWQGPGPAPFALAAADGSEVRLSDFRGKVVLLHFFATWCEPCRPELVALERLRRTIGDGLEIVAVSVAEPDDRVRRYFAAQPVGYRVLLDRDRAVARAWRVHALPSTILLDHSLGPVARSDGEVAWDEPAARTSITEALASPPAGR